MFLHQFFANVESDHLTSFLGMFLWNERTGKQGLNQGLRRILEISFQPYPKLLNLTLDPYRLPITKPLEAAAILHNELAHYISNVIKNQNLKDLLLKEVLPLKQA